MIPGHKVGQSGPLGLKGYTEGHLMKVAWMVAIVAAGLLPAGVAGAAAVCKVDSDCVLVAEDCCGCTAGGKQKAISKKDRTSYERDRQARCAEVMCAAVMSQDPSCAATSAACKEGKCSLKR